MAKGDTRRLEDTAQQAVEMRLRAEDDGFRLQNRQARFIGATVSVNGLATFTPLIDEAEVGDWQELFASWPGYKAVFELKEQQP